MRRTFTGVIFAALTAFLAAQNPPGPSAHKTQPAPGAPVKVRPKLDAKQQHALHLLELSQAESGSLGPDMRAFILWHAAQGLEAIDKDKSKQWFADAFRASQSVEERRADTDECGMDEVCHVKRFLQLGILRDIATRSPQWAEKLLPYADASVRDQVTASLVSQHTAKHDIPRAKALLAGAADAENYPYSAAMELMDSLPTDADRLSVFTDAANNFKQHSHGIPLNGDLGEMVSRFYKKLPPAVVLEAIDTLLNAAKEQDKSEPVHIAFSTTQGKAASFDSAYETRLFQLIPALQELDPSRAEDLLKEDATLRATMAEYPQGLGSVKPPCGAAQPNAGSGFFSSTYSSGGDSQVALNMQAQEQLQAQVTLQMNKITHELAKDPKEALADALNLPVSNVNLMMMSPRTQALLKVARGTVATEPEVSKNALDEIRKNVDSIEPGQAGRSLSQAVELYLRLGRPAEARSALSEVLKAAEKLYKQDSSGDDPNLAFKGVWPSTGLWMKCVQLADTISPGLSEQVIAEIPDSEIATYQRVAYANSLLGRKEFPESAEQHKNGLATIMNF
jgi:hypothetical protein